MIQRHSGTLKAVIFDLDGTLYQQRPLRRAMTLKLIRAHLLRVQVSGRTADDACHCRLPRGRSSSGRR